MAGSPGGGSSAGASARRKAEEHWRAREREDEAFRNWSRGAEGEEATARVLDRLSNDFYVAHDLPLADSDANVDHLVIGPFGVFVIDSKNFGDHVKVTAGKGILWRDQYPLGGELRALRWEASKACQFLGITPTVVMCFASDNLRRQEVLEDGLIATNLSDLKRLVSRGDRRLGPTDVARLAVATEVYLGRFPAPEPAVPAGTPARVEAVSRRANSPRSNRMRSRRRTSTRSEGLVLLVGAIVLMLAAPRIARWMGDSVARSTSSDSAPTGGGTFHCVGRGEGWTLRLAWPDVVRDEAELSWMSRPTGSEAWTPVHVWRRSESAPRLAGVEPGASLDVEMSLGSVVVTSETLTAPSERC